MRGGGPEVEPPGVLPCVPSPLLSWGPPTEPSSCGAACGSVGRRCSSSILGWGHGPATGQLGLAKFWDFLKALRTHVQGQPGKDSAVLAEPFDRQAGPEIKERPTFATHAALSRAALGRAACCVSCPELTGSTAGGQSRDPTSRTPQGDGVHPTRRSAQPLPQQVHHHLKAGAAFEGRGAGALLGQEGQGLTDGGLRGVRIADEGLGHGGTFTPAEGHGGRLFLGKGLGGGGGRGPGGLGLGPHGLQGLDGGEVGVDIHGHGASWGETHR